MALIHRFVIAALIATVPCAPGQVGVSPDASSVVQSATHQAGINIGATSFYDQGMIWKNLLEVNSSFEPNTYSSVWVDGGYNGYTTNEIKADVTVTGNVVTRTDGGSWPTNISGNVIMDDDGYGNGPIMCSIASVPSGSTMTISLSYPRTTSNIKLYAGTGLPGTAVLYDLADSQLAVNGLAASGSLPAATLSVVESQGHQVGLSNSAYGCTATVTGNTNTATITGAGVELYFTPTSSGPCSYPITQGDTIILTQYRFPTPDTDWSSGNVMGIWPIAGTVTSSTDTCGTQCGVQSLSLNGASQTAGFHDYFDSEFDDLFVLVSGPHTLSYMYKCAGTPKLTVTVGRSGGDTWYSSPSSGESLTCDSTWRQASDTVTGTDTASTKFYMGDASWMVTGGTLLLDNISLVRNTYWPIDAYNANHTIFRDEWVAALQHNWFNANSAATGTLRLMTGNSGEVLDDWITPTRYHKLNSSGSPANYQGGQTKVITLPDFLELCKYLGVNPYIAIPTNFTATDAAGLMNYLGGDASVSGSYAARRAQASPDGSYPGQSAPWTQVFSEIYLSFSNESWNYAYVGQGLGPRGNAPLNLSSHAGSIYYDYSLRAHDIYAAIRGSSDASPVVHLGFNASAANTWLMQGNVAYAKPDYLELAPYWLMFVRTPTPTGTTCNSLAADGLWCASLVAPHADVTDAVNSEGSAIVKSVMSDYPVCGASGALTCPITIYEENSTAEAGNITQPVLDSVTAGAGNAVVMANLILKQVQAGVGVQNAFSSQGSFFSAYSLTNAHYRAKVWGLFVDFGGMSSLLNANTFGGNYVPRPGAIGAYLANQAIIGEEISCGATDLSGTTYNFPGDGNGSYKDASAVGPPWGSAAQAGGTGPQSNVPWLDLYCFKNGSSYAIAAVNSSMVGSFRLVFQHGYIPQTSVVKQQFAVPVVSGATVPGTLNEPSGVDYATNPGFGAGGSPGESGMLAMTLSSPLAVVTSTVDSAGIDTLPPLSVTVYTYGTSTPTAAAPVFSPTPSGYATGQTVSMSVPSGASICYTTNGSVPSASSGGCTSGFNYSVPITVSTSLTLKAIAFQAGHLNSRVTVGHYSIDGVNGVRFSRTRISGATVRVP
jgi:hypothetical protein